MNKETAIAQANLNRINEYTPYGSTEYKIAGTNPDGTPKWSRYDKLDPSQQRQLNQTNQLNEQLNSLAGDQYSRVAGALAQPFSYKGMTPMATSVGKGLPGYVNGVTPTGQVGNIQTGVGPADGFSADARRVSDALYGQATSRLDPQFQQGESDMRSRLAAQGISENSDAYRRELDNFGRNKTDAYNDANYRAIQAGGDEQSRLFGLDLSRAQFGNEAQQQQYDQGANDFSQRMSNAALANANRQSMFNEGVTNANFNNQARTQQIEEATYLRNLPINEIAALLGTGGGVTNPTFSSTAQVGVNPTDYSGIVQSNYAQQMNAYQQAQQRRGGIFGTIAGVGGQLGGAAIMASDMRLKTNISRIGKLANGIPTYAFNYLGSKLRQFGVMAQDVINVLPEAVIKRPDGYMMVNYGKVYAHV